MTCVKDIVALIDGFAPFDSAESYDNAGLLLGHPDRPVRRIMTALDLTPDVAGEALRAQADLVVTHHPIFFRGRKSLTEDDAEGAAVCALIRGGISLIAAHTNFDEAERGVNDALCEALSLHDVQAYESGMRVGVLTQPLKVKAFASFVGERLHTVVRVFADAEDKILQRIAVIGGAGSEFYTLALEAGADAFITGEMKHHHALDAVWRGLTVLEAGHGATELPSVGLMTRLLTEAVISHGMDIDIIQSQTASCFGRMT